VEQLNKDLAGHFAKRLRQLIYDTGSVMDAADIDEQEITRLILIGLMHEVMSGFISLGLDELEILRLTSKSYHEVWRALRRADELQKATAKAKK
jgi:hypothetical protein